MPSTSGIVLFTDHAEFGPVTPAINLNIHHNSLTNFVNSITIFNHVTGLFGGLPPLATVVANYNTLTGFSNKGICTGPGTGSGDPAVMDATLNYWGTISAANILEQFVGPLDPAPWSNAAFTETYNFDPVNSIYNPNTGAPYSSLTAAVGGSSPGDEIFFTEPGTFNLPATLTIPLNFVNISGEEVTFEGNSPALTISAGSSYFYGVTFTTSTNSPTIQITGGSLKLRNCVIVSSTGYNNAGVELSTGGTLDAGTDAVTDPGYNRFVYTTGDYAINNISGTANAYGDYWGKGTAAVPAGPALTDLSGVVNFTHATYPTFPMTKLDLALYSPSCGIYSVKLKSFMRDLIHVPTTNECVLNNLVFTIRWPNTEAFSTLSNVNLILPGLALQGSVISDGSYYYATYATMGGNLNWTANVENEIMTFQTPGAGLGTFPISISNDAYTAANNRNYYVDMISNGLAINNAAGAIYNILPQASRNCGIYAKAFLTGPYGNPNMTTNLSSAPNQIPTSQPFNTSPWFYAGTETATITTDITDWVLVELRSTTTTLVDRKAGLLNKNGNIYGTDGTSPIIFNSFVPGNSYYIVINHRNHSPLMSGSTITLPNTDPTRYDFTVGANLYGSAPAILNAGSIYSMVPGDLNHDGKLKYSGANNDRALIIAKLGTIFSPVYLNSVSTAGYWLEDLNMNRLISYSGLNNDASAVIYPALTNLIPGANLISTWTCPVPNTSKFMELCPHTGNIDAKVIANGNDLEVVLETKDLMEGAYVDNIQFGLTWNASMNNVESMLATASSKFNITPQGKPVQIGNKMYQMFAMVDWKALPDHFAPGMEVTVLSIPEMASFAGKINMNTNDIIENNDFGYYVSIFGKDQTGLIKNLAENQILNPVNIYPNPANNNNININVNALTDGTVNVVVLDLVGKQLVNSQFNTTSGLNKINLTSDHLKPGAYLIHVTGASVNYSTRLVIQ
jgi:hypothetical protein